MAEENKKPMELTGMTLLFRGKDESCADVVRPDAVQSNSVLRIVVRDGGMASGAPSVHLIAEMPDGKQVVINTTAKLLLTNTFMIDDRYPGLIERRASNKGFE